VQSGCRVFLWVRGGRASSMRWQDTPRYAMGYLSLRKRRRHS